MLPPLTQQFRPSGPTLEKRVCSSTRERELGTDAGRGGASASGPALRAQEIRGGFLEEVAPEPGLEGQAQCEGQALNGPWASSGSFHGVVDRDSTVRNYSWIS